MSDDAVIRRVSASFVPVALNLYTIRVAQDAGGELFRSVQKQKDQYQGIWIVAPEGKVLAGYQDVKDYKTWAQEVLATIDSALEAFGPVTPRAARRVDPLPFRGLGVRPDGGITLAIEVRHVYGGHPDGDGVVDSLTLPEANWAGLVPPRAGAGTAWAVPDPLARRFCRLLSPSSDQSTMPRPEEVTAVRIVGRVRAVEGGVARLSYRGTIAAAHTWQGKPAGSAEARLTGIGSYEVKSGRLLSFLLVADGTYRMPAPYDYPLSTGAAVEWRREPDRTRRPGGIRPATGSRRRPSTAAAPDHLRPRAQAGGPAVASPRRRSASATAPARRGAGRRPSPEGP